jgi:hypothetical protein
VLHPIGRTHPVSGRKGLYVSPRFTVGIQDMDDAEARPLLDTLFAYQTAPGNVYRHKWTVGDFVMWDNRSSITRPAAVMRWTTFACFIAHRHKGTSGSRLSEVTIACNRDGDLMWENDRLAKIVES